MTAEVAVINKSAVAIASDSAVTIELIDSSGRINDKIYNTANKLFSLSKYAPIGIMVYNTMELGGVPWETIIKEYRKHIVDTKFDHLEQYADNFFDYLCGNTNLFPEKQIQNVLLKAIVRYFVSISATIKSNRTAKQIFDKEIAALDKLEYAESFSESNIQLPQEYISQIDAAANMVFKKSLIRNLKTKYRKLATLAIIKEEQLSGYTGVVITGFGERDVFPKLIEYKTDLILLNKVRKKKIKEYIPEGFDAGKVLSFAQEDITRTILDGINPSYAQAILNSAVRFIANLPDKIIDDIVELDAAKKGLYKKSATLASMDAIKEFFLRMDKERVEKHTFQIENAIQMMPFSELAEIAELFIKLTQVRRRLSPDSETVGGPIDVAVISKADGFVWIKRKFYFDKNLNYSFYGNYFDATN
ncbi:MAG: hypothetical protein AB2717_13065 [Candidatus Thiodiazotropha sp.]